MRIVCQKCSAAYAIDDKFVTPKGVRAQCPRCRHLQLVKKDEAPAAAPAAAPAPGGASPFLFDMGGPPPPAPASGMHFGQTAPAPAAPERPFDFGSLGPPPVAPPPAQTANPFDFGAPAAPAAAPQASPFDFGAPAAPPPADSPFDFGAPSARGPDPLNFDFGAPPPPPPTGKPSFPTAAPAAKAPAASAVDSSPFDFSSTGAGLELSAPSAGEGASGVKCRTCGKELSDAFDQALGVCDECRNKAVKPENANAASAPPPRKESLARVPAVAAPPPAPVFADPHAPPPKSVQSATRSGSGGSGRTIGIAVAAVVLLAIAGVLVWKKPWVSKPPPLVVKGGGTPTTGGSVKPAPDSLIAQWRLKYLDLDQKAEWYADEGDGLLAKDTTAGYRDAAESFEQALVLAPSDDRALAGWILALAFGRPGQIDEPTANAAEGMLNAAEQRSGDHRLYVAHAHFLIARGGNPNDIKVLAERGLQSRDPHDQALAALALGQTYLTKNPQVSAENFEKALKLDPKLKRAYFFQAQLAVSQGRYKEATKSLEKRLEMDADQWEASEELARLLLDIGDATRARKVLEAAKAAAPTNGRPRLGLAVLAYQNLGDYSGASTELQALIDSSEQPPQVKAEALLHLGTIQRITGEADKAAASIDRALELAPDSTPAHLQKFLVLLDRNIASSARLELDGLKGKLNDKNLEDTLEGRLMIAEDRLDDALRTLSRVVEADPRRVDATLLAGAAAAKARKDGKAWEFCLKRALRADPGSRPVASLTPYFVRPADLLKPAVGAYQALVKSADEDPSPVLCEGLVAWFSEDYAAADRDFAKTIHIDPRNADAFAYRALGALRKRDVGGAVKLAAKAVDSGRTNGNAHFSQAQALMASKKPDLAKVAAQAALKYSPQLLGAKVVLADVDAKRGNDDDARRTLTTVLLADSYYREAKRVLYEHEL